MSLMLGSCKLTLVVLLNEAFDSDAIFHFATLSYSNM